MATGTTSGSLELKFCRLCTTYGESGHYTASIIPKRTRFILQTIPRTINYRTYNAVVALQARIPAQLDRTWTQDPVTLEDALGRVSRFHLEFIDSWEVGSTKFAVCRDIKLTIKVFYTTLEARFQKLPGHRKIKRKEYTLRSKFIDKDVDTSLDFNRCFLPGQHYEMSMIFNSGIPRNSCPSCFLDTGEASDALVKW